MALRQKDRKRLDNFLEFIKKQTDSFLGYPNAKDFDFTSLAEFLSYPLNNLGDPFFGSTFKLDSFEFEREVVLFMTELFRGDADNFSGYVTNGGSEGNLYGLYLARELYPKGIVYFSQDSHYSVKKNLHLLKMPHIMIQSQENGEVDYEDLCQTLKTHRDKPAIIFANIGTTMTEAKDDLGVIRSLLDDNAIADFYIHSDAALCGGLVPFIWPHAPFDFLDGADSISVSGHKSFGSPIPCGVVIAKKKNVARIAKSIPYTEALDSTISGSRNGLTPLMLWYTIKHHGLTGFQKRVDKSLAMAEYAEDKLLEIGIAAWRNKNAITVVFPAVASHIQERYQLATAGDKTHIILMPNVSRYQVDNFISDLRDSHG